MQREDVRFYVVAGCYGVPYNDPLLPCLGHEDTMDTATKRVNHMSAILLSRGLILSLGLLLLNDFYLKGQFGNWVTGKLSDIAGLFLFPLVFTALFPKRIRAIHLGTAAAFVLFKSPLATPLIGAWNSMGALHIGRVVDATDLLALPMVWAAYLYGAHRLGTPTIGRLRQPKRLATNLLLVLSFFAFAATSRRDKTTPIKMPQTSIPYCLDTFYSFLPKFLNKERDGMAKLVYISKETYKIHVAVNSKTWVNIWSSKYKDHRIWMSIKLTQRCNAQGCAVVPEFTCASKTNCSQVNAKGAKRVQAQINAFFNYLQEELQRSNLPSPSRCAAPKGFKKPAPQPEKK